MRGVLVAVLAALAWVLADLTRIMPARYLAAALLMALLLGLTFLSGTVMMVLL